MKTKPSSFFGFGLLVLAFSSFAPAMAQSPAPKAGDATTAAAAADPLEQLVAPIALYPDVLIALLLPAATESSDVVLAARYLERGGSSTEIDSQPWDQSVKGLAHYPDVVNWMDENLAWTRQLGDAYLESAENVMAAIQRVRARAKASGLLVSTAEQEVVVENGHIRILPAQPNVVYVPRYDPEIIYVERPIVYHTQPWITFGAAFGVGWWLNYDCDWGSRVIVVNPHYRHHWRHHHDWRHHRFAHRGDHHHHWKRWTPSHRHPSHRRHFHHGRDFARPTPHPGAPHHRWNHRPGGERRHGVEPRHGHGDRQRERLGERRLHRENSREHFRQPSQPPSHLRGGGPRGFAVEPSQPRTAPRQRDGNWERRRERDGHSRPGENRQRLAPPSNTSPRPQVAVAAPPVMRSAPERHPSMRGGGNGGERRFSGGAPRPHAPQVAANRPQVAQAPRMSQPARSDMAVRQAPRIAPSGGGDTGHRGGGQQRSDRGGRGHQAQER